MPECIICMSPSHASLSHQTEHECMRVAFGIHCWHAFGYKDQHAWFRAMRPKHHVACCTHAGHAICHAPSTPGTVCSVCLRPNMHAECAHAPMHTAYLGLMAGNPHNSPAGLGRLWIRKSRCPAAIVVQRQFVSKVVCMMVHVCRRILRREGYQTLSSHAGAAAHAVVDAGSLGSFKGAYTVW
jgi:hypothetical protein